MKIEKEVNFDMRFTAEETCLLREICEYYIDHDKNQDNLEDETKFATDLFTVLGTF